MAANQSAAPISSSWKVAGDMEKKTIRISAFCIAVLILSPPILVAQDLFKYRSFSLGTSVAAVLKHTDRTLADVKMIHSRPARIQELTWWPPKGGVANSQSDSVEQIAFSFYNGQLYKISVTYDRSAVKGLTTADMVQSMLANYGAPVKSALDTDLPADQYDSKQEVVANWEDSLYAVNLVRLPHSDGFGLEFFSKILNRQTETAITEAVKLDEQERPEKEAEQRKKEADALEMARQRNRKIFQP